MAGYMTKQTLDRMRMVFDYLRANPWKTRKEIGDALGLDDDQTRKLFVHLGLRQRVRKPHRVKPLEYAMPEVPPNPYKVG